MNTLRAFLFLVVLAAAVAARAEYPEKPVTIVVPFAAGGPTDKVARHLGEAMRKHLGGQSILIDNTAGAGGTIASNKVAKAPNDGYTLLLHHIGLSTAPAPAARCPTRR
jgi:tripartite-type tricarboxylate transporter receptor subunit TctC